MKKQYLKAVFKSCNQKQLMLLPPSLDEIIDPVHPVRLVDEIIDNIDDTSLLRQYKGGGTSSYHPRMLLKVMIYSYLCNIYSSRKMESALKENIHFMWLSGMSRPDHNTLNRFRSEKLKDVLKEIFAQVVMMLAETGHVSLKDVYLDGTKIEANANKYTFVWGKTVKYNKEKIVDQLNELWAYTQKVAEEELGDDTPTDFTPIDPQKIKKTIEKIEEALKGKPVSNEIKAKLKHAKRHWPGNMERYLKYESLLGKRNSLSKTDPDATFMRMKEDHMRNGQLKPGYNLQITTNNQYILSYSLHHNATDILTLRSHIERFKDLYNKYPEALTADAGYGSEENYMLLEEKNIEAYIKYNLFEKDHKKGASKTSFYPGNMHYDPATDSYQCTQGQKLIRIGTKKRISENGHEQQYTTYQAANCDDCPLKQQCNKHEGNKIIDVNHQLNKYKIMANALLNSESGLYHRSRRPIDVEPVFANLKHNKGFKRFNLRGNIKVEIETGLLALAHNLKKKAA
jgi:transposase